MIQQKLDLDQLLQGLTNFPTDLDYLRLITKNALNHYENYHTARAQLAKHDGPSFLAPTWGTTFENSSLWIGGRRPTLIIRLERVADEPLALLAYKCRKVGESSQGEVVDKAMDAHALDMYNILMEADKLRLDILKRMIDILSPLQAVVFLVASKKLHLSLHEWSKRRDIQMGITQLLGTNYNSSYSSDPPPEPGP
ncbi:hypothetical protein L1987_26700 [Smallanthus sonchifolius]|uniref:Uncharacterized protein n=1 Tax=Smallanthus sonchifolius TaxID=185202 RepID=A0ACB9ICP4_9ASTR|nr:hypothetical protein L1987_26700 [Smallanthus sonchifolius]